MNFFYVLGNAVAVIFAFSAVRVSSQDATYVYETESKCMVSFPSVTRDFLEGIKKVKTLPENPTRDFKCFLHCVGKELQAIEELSLLLDMIKTITADITGGDMPEDVAHAVIADCIGKAQDSDECELTWKFVDCFVDDLKEYKLHHTFCPSCNH